VGVKSGKSEVPVIKGLALHSVRTPAYRQGRGECGLCDGIEGEEVWGIELKGRLSVGLKTRGGKLIVLGLAIPEKE